MTHDPKIHERMAETFRRIGLTFPYLAGLIQKIRVQPDSQIETIGIFASGRLLVNPAFVTPLSQSDLFFVLTHELYHLMLKTHERGEGSDRLDFNFAHDYIINDILRHELHCEMIPAGGLDWWDARTLSAEAIIKQMRHTGRAPARSWDPQGQYYDDQFIDPQAANGAGGLDRQSDVLDDSFERRLFPDLSASDQRVQSQTTRQSADNALAMQALMQAMSGRGNQAGGESDLVAALRGLYRPPWELGLQRWLESMAPGDRSYARPSRRGADRTDIVLPGRKREGWTLHIILDTSGSMIADIPAILGAIADFCDAANVEEIHLVQCDADVHSDEILSPSALARYQIRGYGGSDLGPAMNRLAEQASVESTIIITDGEIDYPQHSQPYQVLWVVPAWRNPATFTPPYGTVLSMSQN